MIAKDNEYCTEASNTLYDLYADFNVRERCRDREDYELEQRYLHDTIERLTKAHEQDQREIEQLTRALNEMRTQFKEMTEAVKDAQH